MKKYNWTPSQVDDLDFFDIMNIEIRSSEVKTNPPEQVVYIDQLGI